MIARFFTWLITPRISDFDRGCAFAKEQLAKGRTPESILDNVACSKDFDDYDDFDRGIEKTLKEKTKCK